MCKVCKMLDDLKPELVTGVELSLGGGVNVCLDHFAVAYKGINYLTNQSVSALKRKGYSEKDIKVLRYIKENGLETYANLLQACLKFVASSPRKKDFSFEELVIKSIERSIGDVVDASEDMEDTLASPRKIKKYFDRFIIGQEEAKKDLAIAIHDHYKRIQSGNNKLSKKSNILIVGPSGSGKTYLAENSSKLLNVPYVAVSATDLTAAGYAGMSLDAVLRGLILNANMDIKQAEKGIVYIDEIDKIAGTTHVNGNKDIGGLEVQRELLSMIQGCKKVVELKGNNPMQSREVVIDTTNILFICSGAFVEMQERRKLAKPNVIGFNELDQTTLPPTGLKVEDFVGYGFDIQFISRFACITELNELTLKDLEAIMYKPENSIVKEYQYKFSLEDVDLRFTKPAITAIAEKAKSEGTNARGLRKIVESVLKEYRFNIEDYKDSEVVVNKQMVEQMYG